MVSSIVVETVFHVILKIICHVDIKCISINFLKEIKQPAELWAFQL